MFRVFLYDKSFVMCLLKDNANLTYFRRYLWDENKNNFLKTCCRGLNIKNSYFGYPIFYLFNARVLPIKIEN